MERRGALMGRYRGPAKNNSGKNQNAVDRAQATGRIRGEVSIEFLHRMSRHFRAMQLLIEEEIKRMLHEKKN
jgi:hypothetical protein